MIKGRPPRLPHIFQSYDAPLFFVTVCTLHRRKIPSLKAANEAVVVYGTRAIKEFNVALGRYVVMPDHLHFFVRGDQNFVLGNWVKGLKRAILKAFPKEKDHSLWQPGFFDHLLRNDESYAAADSESVREQAGRLYNFVPGIATALPAIAEAPRRRVSPCRQLNASTQRGGYNLSR